MSTTTTTTTTKIITTAGERSRDKKRPNCASRAAVFNWLLAYLSDVRRYSTRDGLTAGGYQAPGMFTLAAKTPVQTMRARWTVYYVTGRASNIRTGP